MGAGLGVAGVPEASRHVQLEGVVYKPLDGLTVTADISLVYQTDRDSPPLALLLSCLDDTPL